MMEETESIERKSATNDEILAQYQTTRVRTLWKPYKRIFQITANTAITLDPNKFTETNTFAYTSISKIGIDEKHPDQFNLELEGDRTVYKYKTAHRPQLLCQLFECINKKIPSKFKKAGPFTAQRVRKNGSRVDCKLIFVSYGIVEVDIANRIVQEYKWVNFSRFGSDEKVNGLFFEATRRTKIFYISDINLVIENMKYQLKQLGLDDIPYIPNQDLTLVMDYRFKKYSSIPTAVSIFDVNKITNRSLRPMPRQMHISEDFIMEKDASGFQFISYQRIETVYALVRSWNNPREFSIEYNDGSSRTYTSTTRDSLLAMLLDVCHAAGNIRVIVTGEVSDGLRLMPRFAEEEYQSSIKDAFFGASSIEAWYLNHLSKVCKNSPNDSMAVEQACKELNANVPCPGISPSSDPNLVKSAMSGVLKTLHAMIVSSFTDERADHSRAIATLLQTLFRLIPCIQGFKGFVEVREVDTRLLILQLLKMDNDFINYWTLEVLMVLCRCPLDPRNMQQEFVNKQTLLTDRTLKCLIELMVFRPEIEESTDQSNAPISIDSAVDVGNAPPVSVAPVEPTATITQTATQANVDSNPTPTSHLSTKGAKSSKPEMKTYQQTLASGSRGAVGEMSVEEELGGEVNFIPNSLVVIGAAALLESLVCSRRDTSSPELLNTILDLLGDRCEALMSMLRSTSFLIMENAAILMFTLIKNRPAIAPLLKELALSDCLVLKHFYNAVFSPSGTQRFISRFLVATWMAGSEKTSAGKALLLRMIPSGLVEYLKFKPITEEHRTNLDMMEDEFYAQFANAGIVSRQSGSNTMQARMRKRISAALREQLVERPAPIGVLHTPIPVVAPAGPIPPTPPQPAPTGSKTPPLEEQPGGLGPGGLGPVTPQKPKEISNHQAAAAAAAAAATQCQSPPPPPGSVAPVIISAHPGHPALNIQPENNLISSVKQPPENYRIMFHMMTQDHKLPDLIWNEQTRLELRSTLEAEIKEYEREQRLMGSKKIAWNYQQFFIHYESLRDEMQVGPIYVRYFLDAGDAFLRSLENPSHVVLFEKLFRRVLVNVESNPPTSILCARCLSRLYETCKDIIGGFDDMLILVRMLHQATNLELQHVLLDLMVALSLENTNLLQLLDKSFVNTIIRYASLAHINPDQIGNVLARATTNVLMLKDGSAEGANGENVTVGDTSSTSPMEREEKSEEDINRQLKRSLWVPDDVACPKVWFAAPPGTHPPPKLSHKGPYRVSELLTELDRNQIKDDWYVAPLAGEEGDDEAFDSVVDTGRWKPIDQYFQLRMQMLFPGKAVYSPAEVAAKALHLLRRLAAVHRSANSKGVPFYPIPMSKRLMSDPGHLCIFAQLLLSNDGQVVEVAADLLRSLVEFNSLANSKLYLTGAFFFACRYTGNNFAPLAWLFHSSHLNQSFHDSAASVARDLPVAQKSVLGNILPPAMVYMLHNYGPDRFAIVFTGDWDNPEVIWNASLRKHMVEMIDQHLGDYPARLRQFTLAEYEYCPIPKVHYATLDKEIYVHEYYLRNLCDEVRFPEWPIGEPLVLLRESIERWRAEMAKTVVDSSIQEARELLGLSGKYDNLDLRKAYKVLARKYHPDKNPDGRDMFEKIHVAYELLSSVELNDTETDMLNVVLLIKTQNIVYRRFPNKISDQKYPAYALLISILHAPSSPQVLPTGQDAELLRAGVMLMYHSTHVSPLNAGEFVKAGAVGKLYTIVSYAIQAVVLPENAAEANVTAAGPNSPLLADLLTYGFKTFTAVSQMEIGREAILNLCPLFAEDMYRLLAMNVRFPMAIENCIEVISRCCTSEELQKSFIAAGLIWRLVPLILAYDGTVQDDYTDETQRIAHNQIAANMHAIVATKALGRLGGYMFNELASPKQESVQRCLGKLLTPPLAKLLRNRLPWDLLQALNENVEKTTKIWNVGMRKEMIDFITKVDKERVAGSSEEDLQVCETFQFSALKEELAIGDVYVRVFNKTGETVDIDDPTKFCMDLIAFITVSIEKYEADTGAASATPFTPLQRVHLDYAVEGLFTLARALEYIAFDIGKCPDGIKTTLLLLEQPPESGAFAFGTQLLAVLFESSDFVTALTDPSEPSQLWRFLRCLCTVGTPPVSAAWTAAEALVAIPDGLAALLVEGAVARLLGVLMGVEGYANVYQSRLAAISLLSKFLWNPVKGAEASAMLRRFIPEPVVLLLRSKAGSASLQVLDSVCENPELIWTAEMQVELRKEILNLLGPAVRASNGSEKPNPFSIPPNITPDYYVKYRQLSNEIYVGGVYIRLYLKQPTFHLSNPILFIEKLVEFWESAFNVQVPTTASAPNGSVLGGSSSDSREVVLGNEDFLTLLTSCIVCVIKGEGAVVEHLILWGFVSSLCDLLQRALSRGRRGSPMVCIVRLLFQLSSRVEVLDSLASLKVSVIALLTNCIIHEEKVHKDATLTVELLKKIFQCLSCRYLGYFAQSALSSNLPNILLDKVLGASPGDLSHVQNQSALKIHSVDLIKAIISVCDEESAIPLQTLLDLHPAWRDFKHQSHDLFITDQEKTDVYLIQDAMDTKFAGLLTDGTVATGISEFFTSTGVPPAHSASASNNPFNDDPPEFIKKNMKADPTPAPPAESPSVKPNKSRSSSLNVPGEKERRSSEPVLSVPTGVPVRRQSETTHQQKVTIITAVTKGAHGIGLDLTRTKTGEAQIMRLKEMPPNIQNPATLSDPAFQAGDVIVAVNGVNCPTFNEVVAAIRSGEGKINLTLDRLI